MYGDFKWIFSIYAPPRFWEAANARTINIVPRFTNTQLHFPDMKDGEHYLSYDVDFSDINELSMIRREQYEYISNNCYKAYNEYIKGTEYIISTKLLEYMFKNII